MVVFFASKPTRIERVTDRYSYVRDGGENGFAVGGFRDPRRLQFWELEWEHVNGAEVRATRWQFYQLGGECSGWFLWLPPKSTTPVDAKFHSKISYSRLSETDYRMRLTLKARKTPGVPAAALGPVVGSGLVGGFLIGAKA